MVGGVAGDRDELAHAELPRGLAHMHEAHDVGLIGREWLRERWFESDHPAAWTIASILLGAADIEQAPMSPICPGLKRAAGKGTPPAFGTGRGYVVAMAE